MSKKEIEKLLNAVRYATPANNQVVVVFNGAEYTFGDRRQPFTEKTREKWLEWIKARIAISSRKNAFTEKARHLACNRMCEYSSQVFSASLD